MSITIIEARIPIKVNIDETKIYKCHNVLGFSEGDTHDIVITHVFEENDGFGPSCEVWYEYDGRKYIMSMISVKELTKIIGEDIIKQI